MKRSGFKRKGPKKASGKAKKSKLPKPRVWSDTKADEAFSLQIRQRDGRCLFPGCLVTDIKKLQNSHYLGRRHSATRYLDKNCISLCWLHHIKDKLVGFEYQKQTKEQHGYDGQYTLFMKKWLGEEEFYKLIELGKTTVPRSKVKIAMGYCTLK